MFIGLSHGGTTHYSSPSRPNEVWVGTREGIAVIERAAEGDGWRIARRLLEDKHISAILTEPESGLTFVGAFHGSVQVTADNGKTWETRNSGLTEHNVYSLASPSELESRGSTQRSTRPPRRRGLGDSSLRIRN